MYWSYLLKDICCPSNATGDIVWVSGLYGLVVGNSVFYNNNVWYVTFIIEEDNGYPYAEQHLKIVMNVLMICD